jgi:iron complex outermembrane receptor protein
MLFCRIAFILGRGIGSTHRLFPDAMMQNGVAPGTIGRSWKSRTPTALAIVWLALASIASMTAQVVFFPIRAAAEDEVTNTDAEERDASDPGGADADEVPDEQSKEPDRADDGGGVAGVETIVVRGARSQLTSVDAPSSVVSFDPEDLTALGASDISGLSQFTPNLEVKAAFAASNPTLFIRGVGLKDYFSNAASAVAVYNDRIYMNSPTGQLFQMFDLEGVEILRGPQGVLFGRNATAGAIRVLPQRPSGDFGGFTTVAYGKKNLLELEGAVDTPLVPQVLSARISGRLNMRDGIMKNRCADLVNALGPACRLDGLRIPPGDLEDETNDVNNWAARGMFELQPMSSMNWMLNLSGGRNRSTATQFQGIGAAGGV